jgi:hypothetical protein
MRGFALSFLFMGLLLATTVSPAIARSVDAQIPSAQPVAAMASSSPVDFPSSTWLGWARVAWRYWNNCWNPSTGLEFDSCTYAYFTLWGLASNIFATVDAQELGLISDATFTSRVNLILNFLTTMSLNSDNVPYLQYSSSSGSTATTSPTDGADYGRLLTAAYVLKQLLVQLGLTSQVSQLDSALIRVNVNYFAGTLGGDAYAYYASLGFTLWGLIQSTTSSAQSDFDSLMKTGPFASSSSMYGISGIPANTKIDAEPFVDAILEAGNLPQVTGLPSWNDFLQLSRRVYNAQESRSNATGKTEFWSEGGLDFSPGFDYQWLEWNTGTSWTVLDANLNPLSAPQVPVAFFKLAFAYNALYNTAYTQNTLNNYASHVETNDGFEEGLYANNAYDSNLQVQSNEMILTAANYALQFDFSLSNSGDISIIQGAAASNTITTSLTVGSAQSVSLACISTLPTGASCSFNPPSGNPNFSSILTISTTSATPTGTYGVTVSGTGGGLTRTTQFNLKVNLSTSQVGDIETFVLNTTAHNVTFVLPDYMGPFHNPASKCGGVDAAQLSDYSAAGYVLGLLPNPQYEILDNSASINQTDCGNPTGVSGTIVTLAGPGVNEVAHYYEQVAAITPVYFAYNGVNNFVVRATGKTYPFNTTSGADYFVIQGFTDNVGRHVFVLYGFSWQGTLAAGVFFASYVYPQISQFSSSWYVYEWQSVASGPSHNSFPDPGDTYTLVASSGPTPVLATQTRTESGAVYSGFARINSDVFQAGPNAATFILPDYNGPFHSPAAKCDGVNAASLSDYSAGGYVLSATLNVQQQTTDVENMLSQSSGSCGEPLVSGAIVTISGPGVNEAVHYYEQVNDTAPVYFTYNGENNFIVRATGKTYPFNTTSGADYFLLETFTDSQGRHVYVIYGFSWQGTLAAATFLNTHVRTHLNQFTNSWYIYEWQDAASGPSHNTFPDPGDTYTIIATG